MATYFAKCEHCDAGNYATPAQVDETVTCWRCSTPFRVTKIHDGSGQFGCMAALLGAVIANPLLLLLFYGGGALFVELGSYRHEAGKQWIEFAMLFYEISGGTIGLVVSLVGAVLAGQLFRKKTQDD